MRFGRERCLHKDYLAAAEVYCWAASVGRNIVHAVMTNMGRYFADADSAGRDAALEMFMNCALSDAPADTAAIRDWIAAYYGRHGHFEREITTLARLNLPTAPSGRRLADVAKTHFANRRYRHAATAATAAYEHIEEEESNRRNGTAFVAHQAYLQLGIRDSALAWLQISGITGRDAQFQAAALNQETGHLEAAAELINSMTPSITKDTLLVRQRIFEGIPGMALSEMSESRSVTWARHPQERLLWRARCMIFGGRAHEASSTIDSIRFSAAWHGASETLRYRYWIQKLDGNANMLNAWGKLEHLIYIGDLTGASRTFIGYGITGEAGEMMAVRVSRELTRAARHSEALLTLESIQGGKGPEYLYFLAEALHGAGRTEEAREIVNKILMEFPSDIFAQKARILLMQI
jgi:tetratricopeptide (TPR) repeat protein